MIEIENYRNKRPWIKVYAFLYNNKKTITAVFAVVVPLFSIIGTLVSVKKTI